MRPLINMANATTSTRSSSRTCACRRATCVGEENRGWYVGTTLLDFERSGIGTTASQKRTLEKLVETLRRAADDTRERNRTKLADFVVGEQRRPLPRLRVASMQSRGLVPNYESSVIKIYQSELGQRIYNFGVNMLGLPGSSCPKSRARRSAAACRSLPAVRAQHHLQRLERDPAQRHRDARAGTAARLVSAAVV